MIVSWADSYACVVTAERDAVAPVIMKATTEHVPDIASLLDQIDLFYDGQITEPRSARLTQISDALFGAAPAAIVLIAYQGQNAVGLASCGFLWPAGGTTRSLYLKELFVRPDARNSGVGRHLMDAVIELARDSRCSRVEWTAEADNALALGFYEQMGTPRHAGKIFFRVSP